MLTSFFLFQLAINLWTLFIFILGIAVLFIVFGGLVFIVLWRKSKSFSEWRNFANGLGFNMPNPKKFEMFGTYKGSKLKISIRDTHKSEYGDRFDRTEKYTYCTTELSKPLGLSLNILSKKRYLSDSDSIEIGQPDFDKAFGAKCYDMDVLKSFLLLDYPSDKAQNLLGDLMWAKRFCTTVEVTDNKIYIEKYGVVSDEDALGEMIEVAAYLESRFSTARKKFPLAIGQ